jgi:hypothetical protein
MYFKLHAIFQIIFGPMFSGKTTELIRRLRRYQIAKYKCLIVKYANDDRYSEAGIVSHDHQSLTAVAARRIAEFRHKTLEYDVVGIDEGQFVSSSTHPYKLRFDDAEYFCDTCGFMLRRFWQASSSSDAELRLIAESFGLFNDLFPFPSILDADDPVFNLHLTNILFHVILHLYLGLPSDLLVRGFHLNIFLTVLVSGILCT